VRNLKDEIALLIWEKLTSLVDFDGMPAFNIRFVCSLSFAYYK
jgi:hypothetical protein